MTLKAWRTRDHALSSIQSWEFKPENPQIGMDHQWDYTVKGWVRKKNCQAKIRFPHEICHFQDWTGGNIINKTLYKQSVVISLLSYKSGVLIYTNQWVRKTSGWDLKLACFRFGGTIAIKQKPSQILSGRKSILVGLSGFLQIVYKQYVFPIQKNITKHRRKYAIMIEHQQNNTQVLMLKLLDKQ